MALRKERVVERLVELREQHALTQEQAAQRVGVTHRQWQRWEAGESMPYPRNLDQIAQRFGITVAEFFEGEPSGSSRLERLEAEVLELRAQVTELARDAAKREDSIATLRRELRSVRADTTRLVQDGQRSTEPQPS